MAPKDTSAELVERVKTIDESKTYPETTIRALKARVLLIVADCGMIYGACGNRAPLASLASGAILGIL